MKKEIIIGLTEQYKAKAKEIQTLKDKALFLQNFQWRNPYDELLKVMKQKCKTQADVTKSQRAKLTHQNFNRWKPKAEVGETNGSSIERDTIIKLSFALDLGVDEVDEFLAHCMHSPIHYRNYEDLIYMYYLEYNGTYEEAKEQIALFKKQCKKLQLDVEGLNPNPEIPLGLDADETVTNYIKDKYDDGFEDIEEFHAALIELAELFGSFRRTAYRKFMELLEELEDDINATRKLRKKFFPEEEKGKHIEISEKDLCDFLGMNLPEKVGNRNKIAELLTRNLPKHNTFTKVIKKETNVPREYLICTWVHLHDVNLTLDEHTDTNDAYDTALSQLDHFLKTECGMYGLDHRLPFDWLIANTLAAAYFANNDIDDDGSDADDLIYRIELFGNEYDRLYDKGDVQSKPK